MKVKKLISLFLAATIASGCLAGCHGDGKDSSPVDSSQAEQTNVSDRTESVDDTVTSEISEPTASVKTDTTIRKTTVNDRLTKTYLQFDTPSLPGSLSGSLLQNPDRGFRLETMLYIGPEGELWQSDTGVGTLTQSALTIDYYMEEQPQLAQTYVYLTEYKEKDLDQKAFDAIHTYFDSLASKNLRILLRFAYHGMDDSYKSPTAQQIIRHIEQLKPLLAEYEDLIYVVQAGFVGAWGEWHSTPLSQSECKSILEATVDAVPAGLQVQVRYGRIKNLLDEDDPRRARIAFHDDYLVGYPLAGYSTADPGSPSIQKMVARDCLSTINDGEMPYGNDQSVVTTIDPFGLAKYLLEYRIGSLSIMHHYKENGFSYAMEDWKRVDATPENLKANGLQYTNAWFKDETGSDISRSMFEYVRDYMGYYIDTAQVSAKISKGKIDVTLSLLNHGTMAPYTMKSPELLIIGKDGKVISSAAVCASKELQPGKTVTQTVTLDRPSDPCGAFIGLRFTNPRGTPAKLANDLPYQNGVNILGCLVD